MTDKKYAFRVKPGRVFGAKGQYKPGDEVELTAEEAEGFKDKLEPVEGSKVKPTAKKKEEPKE